MLICHCFRPESLVLRPDGMGGRTGLALAPGRPGEEGRVGEMRSEPGRGASGVRRESMRPVRDGEQISHNKT